MTYIVVLIFVLASGGTGRAEFQLPLPVSMRECEEARPLIEDKLRRELAERKDHPELIDIRSWCFAPGLPV